MAAMSSTSSTDPFTDPPRTLPATPLPGSNASVLNRRAAIQALGGGLGLVGLAGALRASTDATGTGTHFRPRAKRVIQLFMNGGPYQGDLFDPKPALNRHSGQRPESVTLRTERPTGGLLASPFGFRRSGKSGVEVGKLLPRIGACIDDVCVLRSVYSDHANHGPALYMMNSGITTPTRPSMGAWLSYGLGCENENLPSYVVLCPGRPVRFNGLWSSAFLPGEHQGIYVNHSDLNPEKMIPYVRNSKVDPVLQRRQLELLSRMNSTHLRERGSDRLLEARLRSMETAYRMQFEASDAFDLAREPEATREAYGRGHFANGCLLARRLAERGVRCTQVYYGDGQPWDTHNDHNKLVPKLCANIDRPIAALLNDLKSRGMLEDTLVIWGGEFGRTPTSEKGSGRDHNHWGFSMWLAGGGVRGGMTYGATDDFGFRAVRDRVHVHDLHATILYLLGLDHQRLTYRHAGRDYRLTDVHGEIVEGIIA